MKAVCWWGKGEVRVVDVPDPKIINPHDAIVRVSLTAICGSDLHLYDGYVSTMMRGDVLGHEFMGEVVEVGAEARPDTRPRSSATSPSFLITHRVRLDEAPEMYRTFRDKQDGCIKVVLKP